MGRTTGESSLAHTHTRPPSSSERLLWRLWVAPERERAASPWGGPLPRRAAVSTWGGQRERKPRRPVRIVE